MKFNARLRADIERFQNYIIVVEGKKDIAALKLFGFGRIYAIHQNSVPLRERIEQIMANVGKKDRVCILTDLDRAGKLLYEKIKPVFQELGAHLDSSFRGILIKTKISHIEGITKFMEKVEGIT